MQKSLICFGAAVLLSAAALGGAHCLVTASGETVTMRETTLAGDFSAAQGLTAQLTRACDNQLFFETVLPFGQEAKTQFGMSPKPVDPVSYDAAPVRALVALNSGWESLGSSLSTEDIPSEYHSLIDAMSEEAAAGTTFSQDVFLRDMMDFLPISWRILLPQQDLHEIAPRLQTNRESILADLQTAFSFPVPEELRIQASIRTLASGGFDRFSIQNASQDLLREATRSVTGRNSTYFIPQMLWNGKPLPSTPLGPGLYCLPNTDRTLSLENDLKQLCTLPPEDLVLDLAISPEEQIAALLVLTPEGRELRLLDLNIGAVTQQFPLPTDKELSLVSGQNCFLLFMGHEDFRLYTVQEDGTYGFAFSGQLPETTMHFGQFSDVLWDGHRLAILENRWNEEHRWDGLTLAILDQDGVQYNGILHSSLDQCVEFPEPDYAVPLCPFQGFDAIELSLSQEVSP